MNTPWTDPEVIPNGALTAQQVAAELEVTPTRVRQMVDEGKLPPPAELSARTHVWPVRDIGLVKRMLAGEQMSPLGSLLKAPSQPLRLAHEHIVYYHARPQAWPVHVRVWNGPAHEGPRQIVLLGELDNSYGLWPNIVEVVQQVSERFLPNREPTEATWFLYDPDASGRPHAIENIVLRYETEDKSFWDRVRRSSPNIAVRPEWRRTTYAELERVVGAPVQAYPAESYTAQTVEDHRKQRRTVEVVYDPADLSTAATSLRTFDRLPPKHQRSALARTCCTILAHEMEWIWQFFYADNRPLPGPFGNAVKASTRTDGDGPTTWAARLVRPTLGVLDTQLVKAYTSEPAVGEDNDDINTLEPILDQLRDWEKDTGEFGGEHRDEDIHAAVSRTERIVTHRCRRADPTFAERDYPATTVRAFDIASYDQRYLNQAHWAVPHQEEPIHRELRAGLVGTNRHRDILFGVDAQQRVIAHAPSGPSEHDLPLFATQWPNTISESLDDTARIVAENTEFRGDAPAYIEHANGHLEPLPRDPQRTHEEWNFGYGGSGPGTLSDAIFRLFRHTDGIDAHHPVRFWIQDQVEHASEESLSVAVADVRRRIHIT